MATALGAITSSMSSLQLAPTTDASAATSTHGRQQTSLGCRFASPKGLSLRPRDASAAATSTHGRQQTSLGCRYASHNGVSLRPALRIASSSSSHVNGGRGGSSGRGLEIRASSAVAEVAEDEGFDLEAFVKSVLPGGFAAARLWGTGRRKTAVARVVLVDGTGKIIINNRYAQEYLQGNPLWLQAVKYPLASLGYETRYDTIVRVHGGGLSGQAQAILLGIARALIVANQANRDPLKKQGLLTRDSRVVERKKYGLKKARKAPQFSKR